MLPVPGQLPPFVGVLLGRLGLPTVGVRVPTLSYLIRSGGSDAETGEPRLQTTPRPQTGPTPDTPARRRAPDPELATTLRTVVREFVHVREPPLTIRERRAAVGRGTGPTASAEHPGINHPSGTAVVPGHDAEETTPATVEWSVVRHGGWTGAVGGSPPGTQARTDVPPASTRSVTPRDGPAPFFIQRETTTSTTPRGRPGDPTGSGNGRRWSTAQSRLAVASGIDTQSVGESSWETGRSQGSDAFGPPAELTVRRAGGATGGTGDSHTGAHGTTTQSVDLTDLGGTSGQAGRTDPATPTRNSGTLSTGPSLDLSQAPRAEVDRFVDRLYGELTRKHRIERERRGR